MKEIELLEKLVEVQEMHIELIQDCNFWKNSYKELEEVKNRINDDLNNTIEEQAEKIEVLEVENRKLKNQIEELQKLIPIELVGGQEEKQI